MAAGTIVPAGGGRTIFVLPWLGQTLIGTTDNDYEGELDHIRPAEEDVGYLLEAVDRFFGASLTPRDVVGAYAGVRPLISSGDPRKSVDISRKAELYETSSGLITITGGKLTTWRRMAKLAVDRIVERDGSGAPCRTHEIPLGMAVSPDDLEAPDFARSQLAARYGHVAHDVLAAGPAEPIVSGRPDVLAEVVHAVRREQARTVGDVLLRRTRLGLTAARALLSDPEPVERVAAAMGEALGWDATRRAQEVEAFRTEAAAEGILPAP
jgi:glycerol-3-phosphate dehydrogenase